MKKNHTTLINFILIVCILFSGMYFNHAETDSFFYSVKHTDSSTISAFFDDSYIPETEQLCTNTLSNIQKLTCSQIIKKETLKSATLHLSLQVLQAEFVPYYFSGAINPLVNHTAISNRCILCYIHNQDGKKSSHFSLI